MSPIRYEDVYPTVEKGAFFDGTGPQLLQSMWDKAVV